MSAAAEGTGRVCRKSNSSSASRPTPNIDFPPSVAEGRTFTCTRLKKPQLQDV